MIIRWSVPASNLLANIKVNGSRLSIGRYNHVIKWTILSIF